MATMMAMAPNTAPSTEPSSDAVLRPDELLPSWLAADMFAGEVPEWPAADVLAGEVPEWLATDVSAIGALEFFGPEIVGEGEAAAKLVCAPSVVDVVVVLRFKVIIIFSSASAVNIPPDVPQPYQTVSPLLNSSFWAEGKAEPLYECQLRSRQGREYNQRFMMKVGYEPASRQSLTCKRRIVIFHSCAGRMAQVTTEQNSRR